MTDRPDIDKHVERLFAQSIGLDGLHNMDFIEDPKMRASALAHQAAAYLHLSILVDIAALKERGIACLPIVSGNGHTIEVRSADEQRLVWCMHALGQSHVDIIYAEKRGHHIPQACRQLVVERMCDLPRNVMDTAAQIRGFLLLGDMPR